MQELGFDRIWSWSKFNTYHTSTYEYYLKYIKHAKEDRQDCIYTTTGGIAHDIMEKLYTDQIKYCDMNETFEDAWMVAADIANLKFDRNDSEKNNKIKEKYYKSLKHFFNNHVVFKHQLQIEQFITIQVGHNLFQGYIDAYYIDENGNYVILDWKTSSIYKGEKKNNECGQLIVYAMGLHQQGIPYEKIKICWDFLKYVHVEYEQANGKWSSTDIERCQIGEKLQSKVKMWLKKLGYENESLKYLDILAQENSIASLPEDVQSKFKISDCIVFVDITQELIDRWATDIINTIDVIEEKEKQYENALKIDPINADKIFYDDPENVKKESYYFATLCGYSANLHKPYKLYLDKLEQDKNGDLLGNHAKENNDAEEDMSWLNLI